MAEATHEVKGSTCPRAAQQLKTPSEPAALGQLLLLEKPSDLTSPSMVTSRELLLQGVWVPKAEQVAACVCNCQRE